MIWDVIDAVLIINLDGSTERWKKLVEHLKGRVPPEKIHRISAVRGTNLSGYLKKPWFRSRTGERARTCAGAAGCVLSHAKALRYALEHDNWQVVLILEDDARINAERLERMTPQLISFMRHYPSWGLIYPGYHGIPRFSGDIGKGWEFFEWGWFNTYRCSGVLGTFSMLMHRRAWEKILRKLPDEKQVWRWIAKYKAIDYWLQHWFTPFHEVFHLSPPLVSCDDGLISDISGFPVYSYSSSSPSAYLDEKRWRSRYSFCKRFFMKINIHLDGCIRLLGSRLRGYSGGCKNRRGKNW